MTEDVMWICIKMACVFKAVKGASPAKKLTATLQTSKTAKSTCVETRFRQGEPLPNPNIRQAAVLADFSEQIYCLYQAASESEKSIVAFCAVLTPGEGRQLRVEDTDSQAHPFSSGQVSLSALPSWVLELIHKAEKIWVTFVTAALLFFYFVMGHYSITVLIDHYPDFQSLVRISD